MSEPNQQPAGWFPDPNGDGERYWDGRAWTDRRPSPAVSPRNQPAKLINIDRPTTPRFWLRVFAIAGAVGAIVVIIYSVHSYNRDYEEFNRAKFNLEQQQRDFGRNIYDACIRNPGQCG